MKVVILAGGFGTRISEESHLVPKPMIKIGGKPILWHIMQYYASYGFKDFIILAGYKQEVIKDYFNNYYLHNSDMTFYLKDQESKLVKSYADDWTVTVLNTGLHTNTAGRILSAKEHLINEKLFLLTYGDGLSDVKLDELIELHTESNAVITLTAVRPLGRFGLLDIDYNNLVKSFKEKSDNDTNWVNGGFMAVSSSIFNYIHTTEEALETDVMTRIIKDGSLSSYKHSGFWQSMDTLRDREALEKLISNNETPWLKTD